MRRVQSCAALRKAVVFNHTDKQALITGGSAGIGLTFAKQLAAAGHNLILVARSETVLAALAGELSKQFNITVETVSLDLTAPGAVAELHQQTKGFNLGLVVLNAGMETTGDFTTVSAQAHRALID